MVEHEPGRVSVTCHVISLVASWCFCCLEVVFTCKPNPSFYIFCTLLMRSFGTADAVWTWESDEAYYQVTVAATSTKQLQDQAQLDIQTITWYACIYFVCLSVWTPSQKGKSSVLIDRICSWGWCWLYEVKVGCKQMLHWKKIRLRNMTHLYAVPKPCTMAVPAQTLRKGKCTANQQWKPWRNGTTLGVLPLQATLGVSPLQASWNSILLSFCIAVKNVNINTSLSWSMKINCQMLYLQ